MDRRPRNYMMETIVDTSLMICIILVVVAWLLLSTNRGSEQDFQATSSAIAVTNQYVNKLIAATQTAKANQTTTP